MKERREKGAREGARGEAENEGATGEGEGEGEGGREGGREWGKGSRFAGQNEPADSARASAPIKGGRAHQ